MSTIAVFIALGGVGYAAVTLPRNSVGSEQVRRGAIKSADLASRSVTSAKVRNGSLLAKDFRSGQLPAGPRGETGAAGARGAAGPPGVTGFERVQVIHNVVPGDTFVVISAGCPEGKTLLGGGGAIQDRKFNISYLYPQSNDVFALNAVLLPGETVTGTSQAFVVALCGRVG
ncbi:MAG TPA: hypothetical protein VEW95_06120 [Candidatus Limnocylindrales bacterium]|nr:hypothetical protein [Candidatus Limnocylindrales bacterium]